MRSEERLRRIAQATELPLLILAFALIPLLAVPAFWAVPEAWDWPMRVAEWLIWGVFAAVFAAKLAVAPHTLVYLRRNWFEVLIVLLPMLRPLRLLRVLRVLRVLSLLGFNATVLQRVTASKGARSIVSIVLVIMVVGATLTLLAERSEPGANIRDFGDALWWAAVTMATVGYGDHYPVSAAGRGVAVALMLLGIAALSALTAVIAAFLVREPQEAAEGQALPPGISDLLREIQDLRREVAELRAARDV